MYEGKLFGETVRLRNDEYNSIMEFLDPQGVEYSSPLKESPIRENYPQRKEGKPLLVCSRRKHDCDDGDGKGECPFDVFYDGEMGCKNLFRKIVGEDDFECFDSLYVDEFDFKYGVPLRVARRLVKKVRQFIEVNMKKV